MEFSSLNKYWLVKEWRKQRKKLIHESSRLYFFKKCKMFRVFPRCCNVRLNAGLRFVIYNTFKLKLIVLDNIIRHCKKEIYDIKEYIKAIEHLIEMNEWNQWNEFNAHCHVGFEKRRQNCIKKFDKKISFLYKRYYPNDYGDDNYVNLTNENIDFVQKYILQYGSKYVGGVWKDYNMELIASVQNIFDETMSLQERDNIITDIYKHKIKIISYDRSWNYAVSQFKHSLDIEKNICLKEDKGLRMCLIKKDIYADKIEAQLKKLEFNIIEDYNIEGQRMKFINNILKKAKVSFMEKAIYYDIYPSTAICPRIFANIKLHKEGFPLRLMIDFGGSFMYKTAKYIGKLLQDMLGFGTYTVDSSFEFINRIKNVKLSDDDKLVSFDVTELYGSIDRCESIKLIEKALNDKLINKYLIKFVIESLKFISDNIIATYNNKFYKMNKGWPMGLPMVAQICNFTLSIYEDMVLNSGVFENIKIYTRYVDDVFVCGPQEIIDVLLYRLNNLNNLKWTIEKEQDKKIKFLDIQIYREEVNLGYKLIFKPISERGYIHFKSHVPMMHKMASLKSFLFRNDKLCKYRSDKILNIEQFTGELIKVGYDRRWILNTVNAFNRKKMHNNIKLNDKKWISMPFVNSNQLKSIKNIFEDKYNVSFSVPPNVNRLINNSKNVIPKMQRSNIIYGILCGCSKLYIGESRCSMDKRLKEHKLLYNRIKSSTSIQLTTASVFLDHEKLCTYKFAFDNNELKILMEERNHKKRKIKEAILIEKFKDKIINRQSANTAIHSLWKIT